MWGNTRPVIAWCGAGPSRGLFVGRKKRGVRKGGSRRPLCGVSGEGPGPSGLGAVVEERQWRFPGPAGPRAARGPARPRERSESAVSRARRSRAGPSSADERARTATRCARRSESLRTHAGWSPRLARGPSLGGSLRELSPGAGPLELARAGLPLRRAACGRGSRALPRGELGRLAGTFARPGGTAARLEETRALGLHPEPPWLCDASRRTSLRPFAAGPASRRPFSFPLRPRRPPAPRPRGPAGGRPQSR